jgi:hypothetical protein
MGKQGSTSLTTRACTPEEEETLALWSASNLPYCRQWIAQRELFPPTDLLATLQHLRFEALPLTEAALAPLLTAPSPDDTPLTEADPVAAIAHRIAHDLQEYQHFIQAASQHDPSFVFATTARDLRRFHRSQVLSQCDRLTISGSAQALIPAFSLQRAQLYVPRWLIQALPDALFAPNRSFDRPRPTTSAWLLLDAIVLSLDHEYKTI